MPLTKLTPLLIALAVVVFLIVAFLLYWGIRTFGPMLLAPVPLWLVIVLVLIVAFTAPYGWHVLGKAVFGGIDKQIP